MIHQESTSQQKHNHNKTKHNDMIHQESMSQQKHNHNKKNTKNKDSPRKYIKTEKTKHHNRKQRQ